MRRRRCFDHNPPHFRVRCPGWARGWRATTVPSSSSSTGSTRPPMSRPSSPRTARARQAGYSMTTASPTSRYSRLGLDLAEFPSVVHARDVTTVGSHVHGARSPRRFSCCPGSLLCRPRRNVGISNVAFRPTSQAASPPRRSTISGESPRVLVNERFVVAVVILGAVFDRLLFNRLPRGGEVSDDATSPTVNHIMIL